MLIGSDNPKLSFPLKMHEGSWNEPIAVKTRIGWTIYGPVRENLEGSSQNTNIHMCGCEESWERDQSLDRSLKYFFSTESFGVGNQNGTLQAAEVIDANTIFLETTKRVGDRWETGLFWKKDRLPMVDTKQMALKRWSCLQSKMKRNPILKEAMIETITNYIKKGYARKLSPIEAKTTGPKTNYLPIFGIWNENKGKFRIVSDAAAKVAGSSLNDRLNTGPSLYKTIFNILCNFRIGKVAITGDICEMFHQIRIKLEDQDAQRFLWAEQENQEPATYVMQVAIFGATCSPSIAQMVMNKNAQEFIDKYPEAVHAIHQNHYVDDLLLSCEEESQLIKVTKEITKIHKAGGFIMRGFASNSHHVLEALGEDPNTTDLVKSLQTQADGQTVGEMVLGMVWNTTLDAFQFKINFHRVDKEVMAGRKAPTRRQITSAMGSLYDPLGLVAHFRIGLAMLSQELAKYSADWDQPLSGSYLERWQLWLTELSNVTEVTIPRCIAETPIKDAKEVELHVFVDASDRAFSAVAYVRIIDNNHNISVTFLAARAKVGPIKQISVNRMELQAAVLGCRLANQIKSEMALQFTRRYFWYDSMTVGAWINSKNRTYKTFVALRVTELLESTTRNEWRYVRSHQNPADLATKRSGPTEFFPNSLWYCGPEFLKNAAEDWPNEAPPHLQNESNLEVKSAVKQLNIHTEQCYVPLEPNKFSSWWKLVRSTAAVYRACDNFKLKLERKPTISTTSLKHMQRAEILIIKAAQREGFPNEIRALENKCVFPKNSQIINLFPFLDHENVMRMRTRLNVANKISEEAKFPIILPRFHLVTSLKIMQMHIKLAHQFTETVINELRQTYWIPQIRTEVRKTIGHCQRCKNQRAHPTPPIMCPLPAARLMAFVPPFTHTGVDLAGPYEIKIGRSHVKRWIVLFTCLTVRAIHLEVAHNLTSDAFILCLRNFINRRGECHHLYSDCGTNFQGANKELKRAAKEMRSIRAEEEASVLNIRWHWNPPASPHMGGAWERLVRSVKSVLKVIMHGHPLKEDTFQSFLIEAESIINSRPLTFIPLEAEADEVLTPKHFIQTMSKELRPVPTISACEKNARKQWKIAQERADHFWKRWIKEYAPTIAKRTKWFSEAKEIKVGDCVLIVDENAPRNRYEKGVIIKTHFSPIDGRIRSADVKTSSTIRTRPVAKLAVLDLDGKEDLKVKEDPDVKADPNEGTRM